MKICWMWGADDVASVDWRQNNKNNNNNNNKSLLISMVFTADKLYFKFNP